MRGSLICSCYTCRLHAPLIRGTLLHMRILAMCEPFADLCFCCDPSACLTMHVSLKCPSQSLAIHISLISFIALANGLPLLLFAQYYAKGLYNCRARAELASFPGRFVSNLRPSVELIICVHVYILCRLLSGKQTNACSFDKSVHCTLYQECLYIISNFMYHSCAGIGRAPEVTTRTQKLKATVCLAEDFHWTSRIKSCPS